MNTRCLLHAAILYMASYCNFNILLANQEDELYCSKNPCFYALPHSFTIQSQVLALVTTLRTEKNGGAWCPKPPITKDAYEYLQIDLGELTVITMVEVQGRFGNGQIFSNIDF
ncbi:hypothetical protein KUTeg_021674 [Tegillarca granosa]|uniref:F5/8 type C domain-containing protein n=1 Tax=Tegillarca granosa TaxID=220873 RepID=A0ABQ9E4U9_TEGGR|nr:hypothetical protein KUTeg_021674 [Tegillarca granosa]